MKLNTSILLCFVLGATAAVCQGQAKSPGVEHPQPGFEEQFHHTYPLSASGNIAVKNISGFVKIESWDRNEVKVDAVKYAGTKERLQQAQIVVEADPSSISIETRYDRDGHQMVFTDDDPLHNPASVDYTITVPTNANLDEIKLINGNLDVNNLAGYVHASCINGRLRASGLRGTAELSTINGTLEFSYGNVTATAGTTPSREINLKSVNGQVVLTLPSDANAEVHARTVSGFIRNGFGLPVEDGRTVGHSLAGRFGSGGARISLNNVNGSISIERASDGKPLSTVTNLLPAKREKETSF